jgi:hypothetical protein
MTCDEFNEKYKDHLEEGHYGMSIEDEEIIGEVDKAFSHLTDFTYSQIKTKFGSSRVYMDRENRAIASMIEDTIDGIMKRRGLF